MNETVLLKLKIIIERAVRPVKAPLSRKKKMREELLAHVTGVFEEEISHHLDEATALFEVEKRFGDPIELSRKLQETVSTINRVEWHLAQWLQTRPAESLLHRATRVGVMSFVFQLILTVPAIIFVVLYLSKISKMNVLMQGVIGVAFTSVAFGVMSFAVTLLSNGMQQTLFNS